MSEKYFVSIVDNGTVDKFYTDPIGIMRICMYGDCDDYGLPSPNGCAICSSYDISNVKYHIPSSVSDSLFRRAVKHILSDLFETHHIDFDDN